jgi:hypothetical protein
MKLVNPDHPLTDASRSDIAALVRRQRGASGVLMGAINFVGGQVEDGFRLLPRPVRAQIETAARAALRQSYEAAALSRGGTMGRLVTTDRAHKVLAAISGALGGVGGLPTALAELPVATTVIFRAVQTVAASHGEDLTTEAARLECLRVFGAGGPLAGDDGVDTTFVGARLGLSGAAVNGLLSRVAPRFAAVLGQKLAGQAVPVLGAFAGAGTNFAFTRFYTETAHVHFGLRQLARDHGDELVLEEFHRQLAVKR